jgi:hypothetical protein
MRSEEQSHTSPLSVKERWSDSTKMLNDGPDIPHLIAVARPYGATVGSAWAWVEGTSGRRAIRPVSVRGYSRDSAWNLGPVSDGSTVLFTVNFAVGAGNQNNGENHFVQTAFFAGLTAKGGPDRSAPVTNDTFAVLPPGSRG